MGNFYTNITVKGQEQNSLLNYLEQLQRNAYISPSIDDFTVVYDKASEHNAGELFSLASQISNQFNCSTFAVLNHDESVFCYELFQSGSLIDQYISNPGFHDSEAGDFPEGGNAQKLCIALGSTKAINKVRPILREPSQGVYLLASERHTKLIQALKIPVFWASDSVGGYENIERGCITPMSKKDPTPENALSMLKKTKNPKTQNIFQIYEIQKQFKQTIKDDQIKE
jgi:hypothetical protein